MEWKTFKNNYDNLCRIGIYEEIDIISKYFGLKTIKNKRVFIEIQELNMDNDKWEFVYKQDITNKTFDLSIFSNRSVSAEYVIKNTTNKEFNDWLIDIGKHYFEDKEQQKIKEDRFINRIELRYKYGRNNKNN